MKSNFQVEKIKKKLSNAFFSSFSHSEEFQAASQSQQKVVNECHKL
jgi:hypothetical protein